MYLNTMKRAALAVGLTAALSGVAAVPATAEPVTPSTVAGQWQLMGPNAAGGDLAFTPAMPSRLYVLPDRGERVFRSDDHGLTWIPQAGWGIPGAVGQRLAADPRDADVVYVAATLAGSGQGAVLRSDDGARTFHQVLADSAGFTDVVVSPSGQQVFAVGEAGVFASSDGGSHWRQLADSPSGATRVVLDGRDLFVGTGSGIYRIEDALGKPGPAQKMAVPSDFPVNHLSVRGQVLVASGVLSGAVFSTDHGRTWAQLSGPWVDQTSITYTGVTATGEIQVQSIQGSADGTGGKNLWVSADLGQTWSPRPAATSTVDLYTDTGSFPDRPDEEVVSGPAGIFTTRDSATFRRIGVPNAEVDALAVSGPALIAGTTFTGSFRSTAPLAANLPTGYQDWGWDGQRTATLGNEVRGLATMPDRSQIVLRTRGGLCGGDCFALERSNDGGSSWRTLTTVPGGGSDSIAVDPRRPSTVYVASLYPAVGVYSSRNGGATLDFHQFPGLQNVTSVAVDPRTDGGLWIGDVTGLYHSTDGGATAVKVFDGEVYRVAVDPADAGHVVAVGDGLIKVSHDGGASFADAAGVPALTYDTVTFAPGGTLFAASRDLYQPGQGVVRSDDGGSQWTSVSTQPVDRDVHSLLVSPDGRWLFAGSGSGVYRLALR